MLPVVREAVLAEERRLRKLALIHERMNIRARSNTFDLPDERFIELFRLNKRLVQNLIDILGPRLADRTNRKGVTQEVKIFCALRFYATGSYQRCVGQDFNLGLSQTTVHRCIRSVTRALAIISEDQIRLPGTIRERNAIKVEFMQHWLFPGVIGAIDGFHVAILKPNVNEQNFVNRKGYHSINVQIICRPDLKILSLWPNFGGSTHDSYIWRASLAQQFIRELSLNNEKCWFIGDSGYPLQPYLLTPFREPHDVSQQNYNHHHSRARNCIERCIGLFKARFRCLLRERSARYDPNFMCLVIKACAFLHNMCIEANQPFNEDFDYYEDIPAPPPRENERMEQGMQVRQNIVNRYFR